MPHRHDERCGHTLYARPPRHACTGHRAAIDGQPPRQTRELPFWYWPFELIGRLETRLLARHPVEFFGPVR